MNSQYEYVYYNIVLGFNSIDDKDDRPCLNNLLDLYQTPTKSNGTVLYW